MLRNGYFINAFLQGLAIVFFLYVMIFTITLFRASKDTQAVPALSAVIPIARPETLQQEKILQPQPALHENDQIAAPKPVPEDIPHETLEAQPATEHVIAPQPESPNVKDLVEVTPQGPMPKKSASGLSPFEAYKQPFHDPGVPVIAIAFMDYGLSETDSKAALEKLPKEVSFVFNPYVPSADVWKNLAATAGHEFWVYLPIENQIFPDQQDPGPQALLAHSDFKNNQDKFIWAMTRTTGYAGLAGYTDAAFLNAQTTLKTLWNEGFKRGLGYFEINPAGLQGVEMNAIEQAAPYVRNQAIFDESVQDIDQWLKNLELEASNSGYAVGILKTPYPHIVDSVAQWSGGLSERGLALAPVSALAQTHSDPAPSSPPPAPHAPAHAAP